MQWRQDPGTRALFEALSIRIGEGKEQLASRAGLDPMEDRFICGMIRAFAEILEMDYEETTSIVEELDAESSRV